MEYTIGALSMRIDGDIFECNSPTSTDRVPLDRLVVRVDKFSKGKLRLSLSMASEPVPQESIYAWHQQVQYIARHSWTIETDQEPGLREYFVQVGAVAGRPVGPEIAKGGSDQEAGRRKFFGRS